MADDLDDEIYTKLAMAPTGTAYKLNGILCKYNDMNMDTVRSGRENTISETSNLFPLYGDEY